MSNAGKYRPIPATFQPLSRPPGAADGDSPAGVGGDPRVPLLNLSIVRDRMDSLQQFLSDSVNGNTLIGKHQMDMVSSEISTAIHQIIVNGAALLACSQSPNLSSSQSQSHQKPPIPVGEVVDLKFSSDSGDEDVMIPMMTTNSISEGAADLKIEPIDEENSDEWEIMELDAVELLAEHVHFCDVCGKGFKRDANLRMHMRAHGNQFKTPEALAKPERIACEESRRPTRFSCPFLGCNRNKSHKKFRPLKSVICVKNHFKRSHCPKMYSCNRCNKKSFSVVADLKSHQKHCGESKWKCSCGTTFSRKDKLFGHMALFEGHMPAVVDEDEKGKGAAAAAASVVLVDDEDEDDDGPVKEMEMGLNCSDNGLFDELLEGFGSIENYCLQDILDSANGVGSGLTEFRSF